ncbi:MAG TPA: fatty acyl-AMP ligase, partial [Polyangiaceae bacterium]
MAASSESNVTTNLDLGSTRGAPPHPTLLHCLRRWAVGEPDRPAYTLTGAGTDQVLSYGELDHRARQLGAALSARTRPGQPVLLLYPLGLDFVTTYFACLHAGVTPVPLDPGAGPAAQARLRAVATDCGAELALVPAGKTRPMLDDLHLEQWSPELWSGAPAPAFDDLESERQRQRAPGSPALALLQYTSGSTGASKGTRISHANLMANMAMLQSVFGTSSRTVIVTWLPVFHDMGLIGNVLHAVYLGAHAVLLPTVTFLKRPERWLQAVTRFRATFSGAPNFAYDLCVDRVSAERCTELDLSSWEVAFNGAEPVRARTLERFAGRFAASGFRRSSFVPTYGLAEATLVVSGNHASSPVIVHVDAEQLRHGRVQLVSGAAEGAAPAVGVGGVAHGDQRLRIVDPVTLVACEPDRVGEIWVSGAHVSEGYHRQGHAQQSDPAFGARLPGDARCYLRTGDLGFLSNGELFITGRHKDLIIVRGRNLYPQDLELTAECVAPDLRKGASAAFEAGREGEGHVVVVVEVEPRHRTSPEALAATVAAELQREHELPAVEVVVVRRASVPKTTSGKVQRRACRQLLASGSL